jgi:hypothetical protein
MFSRVSQVTSIKEVVQETLSEWEYKLLYVRKIITNNPYGDITQINTLLYILSNF